MSVESERINVAVVGLGYFGSHHARHYAGHPRARFVAVVDADPDRGDRAAAKHGVEAHRHHSALFGKVDAASVAVPTSQHYEVARDLIDAGIAVFIEKPMAVELADAADLVARAARNGVVIQVGHIERFSPAFRALSDRVRSPRLIECVRRVPWTGRAGDVDVVLDLMIHDIDLTLSLVEAPVTSVTASGVSVMTDRNDIAEARLTFANGVVATLTACRAAPGGERMFAVTEDGKRYVADLSTQGLSIVTGVGGRAQNEIVALAHGDNLAAEIDGFLGSVGGGPPPVVDGKAGLEALRIADMILASIAETRAARQPPNGEKIQ